jgi:hypothetical protein
MDARSIHDFDQFNAEITAMSAHVAAYRKALIDGGVDKTDAWAAGKRRSAARKSLCSSARSQAILDEKKKVEDKLKGFGEYTPERSRARRTPSNSHGPHDPCTSHRRTIIFIV